MTPLPIDDVLPPLLDALRARTSLVLEAPPGAGKTTRVPRALLLADWLGEREIVVLEPRRLAARLAARRVAEELGEPLGERVGYQVRFDEQRGPRTRIRFVTEGLFARQLLFDPSVARVGAVVVDEFHERHLAGDLVLAVARQLQRTTRPDLRLIVMSATMPGAEVARYLGDAPLLRSEGRRFAVEVEHAAMYDARPLEQQVASALARLLREEASGDVLVFLPGAVEIRKAHRECAPLAARHDLALLPLHGDLPPEEQDLAVRPGPRRKVILSTNVAETSITIEGVRAVIDSGLARVASVSAWSGLPALKLQKISRASAAQRAGRAGRTGPGRCLRLYTKADHEARPEQEAPEIARLDLAELALSLCGVPRPDDFWLTPPPAPAWEAAESLLRALGALDNTTGPARLGPLGEALRAIPAHPRQARVIVEAARAGFLREGCALAALLAERDLRSGRADCADPLDLLALFHQAEEARFHPSSVRALGVELGAARTISQAQQQLARAAGRSKSPLAPLPRPEEEALRRALLAGYPDRVGLLRSPQGDAQRAAREVALSSGGAAEVFGETRHLEDGWVLALDAETRSTPKGNIQQARLLCPIAPDWVLEDRWDDLQERTELRLVGEEGRVEARRRVLYGALALEETSTTPSEEEARHTLREALRTKGAPALQSEAVGQLRGRARLLAAHRPGLGLALEDDSILDAAAALCAASRRLSALTPEGLVEWLLSALHPAQRQALDELAPARLTLPGGRRVVIEYPPDAPPYAASRLQDFFGMKRGPSLLGGSLPLVLHLLAPNGRAVQVTSDLEGFWQRHYPSVAKELRRRYPRHSWPEDPLQASPPSPGGRGNR